MFYTELGVLGWVQLAACLLGLVWTLACTVMLGLRWKVPAVLSTAPLSLHATLVVVAATLGGLDADAASGVDPAQRATLLAAGASQVIFAGVLGAVAVPSAMLLALGGAAGGVRAPRSYGAPAVAFLACGLAALAPLGGIFNHASLGVVFAKVLLYGGGALPVALSLLGNGQNTNARESSVAASIAFFSVVAGTELCTRSYDWARTFAAVAGAGVDAKGELLTAAAAEIDAVARFGWVSLALATVPLLVAVLRPAAALTEDEVMNGPVNPSGWRIIGTGLALVVPLLWFAATLSADPSGLFARIASARP